MEQKKYRLAEIGKIVSGATPKTNNPEYYGGSIAWITPADLSGYKEKYITHGAKSITQKGYDSCSTQLMPAGTVLFSSRAPIGYVAIANNPVCTNQGFKSIIPNDNVNSEFLYYQLLYLRKQIQDMGSGTTFREISAKRFGQVEVVLPEVPMQERIVTRIEELFSQLDSGVETLEKIKQQLAVYRQAVLEKAFSGALTLEWRIGKELLSAGEVINKISTENNVIGHRDQMEEIELPLLPDNWSWISIGDISKGAEYGTSQKSKKNGKVPVLRMGNIQNGTFDWSDLVYTDDEKDISKYLLTKGDVLFNRTNSPDLVGKTAAFKENREAIFAGYLIRVNQVSEVDYRYLTYYLNCNTAKRYGNKVKTDGVNQSNINSQKLYSYPFPFCSLEEQLQIVTEIESRMSVCDSIEQTVDTVLQQAEAMRKSILRQAFEGGL